MKISTLPLVLFELNRFNFQHWLNIDIQQERRKENSTSPAIHKTTKQDRLKQRGPKTNNKTEAT